MASIRGKLAAIYSLERLSCANTPLHRLHPASKLLATAVYVLCVASVGRYDLARLAPFLLYPVIAITLSALPAGMVLCRAALALPFCAFAGVGGYSLTARWLSRWTLCHSQAVCSRF